jgi:hypothetical protein
MSEVLHKQESQLEQVPETPSVPEPPHSVFPKWQRVTYVYIASLAAFVAPVSSNIYLPAMLSIADELNVSLAKINLTITCFMVTILPRAAQQELMQHKRFSKVLPQP